MRLQCPFLGRNGSLVEFFKPSGQILDRNSTFSTLHVFSSSSQDLLNSCRLWHQERPCLATSLREASSRWEYRHPSKQLRPRTTRGAASHRRHRLTRHCWRSVGSTSSTETRLLALDWKESWLKGRALWSSWRDLPQIISICVRCDACSIHACCNLCSAQSRRSVSRNQGVWGYLLSLYWNKTKII